MRIDAENMAVILAALRYWQSDIAASHPLAFVGVDDIVTDGGKYERPDADYIDGLCESLNCGDFDTPNDAAESFVRTVARMESSAARGYEDEDGDSQEEIEIDCVQTVDSLIGQARKLLNWKDEK